MCIIITAIFLAADNYYTSIQGHQVSILFECAPFVMWLAYPAIGYYIGKNKRDYKVYPWIILMLIGLIACVFETKWLYGFHQNGIGATKLSALVFSFSVIMVSFSEKTQRLLESDKFWYKSLVYVGKLSFGIYLIHKYFLDFLIKPIVEDTLLRACLTLLSSIVVITIAKRILPLNLSRIIGFK